MEKIVNRIYSVLKKSLILVLAIILGLIPAVGFAEPVSFFDTDLATGKDRFKQVVITANGGSADFYEMDIDSALSSNVFSVSNGAGDTAWVRVTQNGSPVVFNSPRDGTGYYHTWSVNSDISNVPDWDTAVANGIHFEFFSDSGLTNKFFVNAFGTHTYDWGTCCINPNPIPPDPVTGDPRTLVGTAIFTIFDADPERYDEMVGNITQTIPSDTHFVAEIDDRDSSFAEITVIPNGDGEFFGVGGYIIFSTVPEESVPPGAGSTPSIPPGNPDLTAATDLGDSSTDNLTSDTTPNFEITYTPQNEIDFVNLYSGPSSTGPWTLIATSAAAGTTSETTVALTSSTLAEGSYYIIGRVENGYWHDESDPSPTPLRVTIDSTPPTMAITAAEVNDGDTSNDPTLSLTFTSSESTTTFNAGDVIVTNGSLSGFSGSGTSYSATLTPDADGEVTVNVPAMSFTDRAGNGNPAVEEFNWISDQTPPTVDFNPADGETIVANEADIILTLSEAIQRASDGADLNDTNIDAHITLKYDNASGLDVPFDATIDTADKVITINPDSALLSNQAYYVAIGTSVEDYAGNPLADDNVTFMSADEALPTLSSSYPSDGLTDVDVNTDLELFFSEPVWGQSGGAIEIRRLSDGSLFESIDVTGGQISGDGTEHITVDITGPLESLTGYYVLISNTSYDDSDGNAYAGINTTTKLNFETEYLDLIPPVVTINPANGESDVSVSSSITISFDEPVRNLDDSPLTDTNVDSLITLKDTDAGGVDIPFDATIDSANQVITINPSSNFDSEQVVYVAIGTSVEDGSDNAISTTNSTFTVEDILPPTLISTTPDDDAVNVGINDNLTMTFDEPVDVEFGTVTIYRSSDDSIFESMSVTSATQVAGGGTDTITINPANTMGYSTSYYVQVDSTAFDDIAGNSYGGFADSTTWNFTTAAENEPPTAVDDNHFTMEDTSVNVDVLSNDSDPNPADTMTITSVTQGSNGSVTNNSTYVTYYPDANFSGTDTFNYTIEDDQGASDTATVTVTVIEATDINVSGGGMSISNGDNTPSTSDDTDFGSIKLYRETVEHTFTVENLGTVVLALTGSPRVEITGAHAADFTVTSQPSSPISNGETTTFSIEFDPSAAGLREAEVSIESDDLADPYTFAIQGTAIAHDSDGDGIIDNDEGDGDRDKDGVANYQDYDPTGYLYDGDTGEIISGGSIEVIGPGDVTIVEDGSEGYYQFTTDGTPGTYTMDVTVPSGYALSGVCRQGDPPAFDPTGEPEPVNLGNSEYADSGFLTSTVCTKFYLSFELEAGDPIIINNNLPLERLPLPDTGFAPGQVTDLALQPEKNAYQEMAYLQLEIPRIGVETNLVGIPAVDGVWDVSWLGTRVGYLAGTAFPTWPGNTVITGHVWNADNSPGIFVDLKNLRYGDLIYIHAWGKIYTYQVRSNRVVLPFDSRSVLEHREIDWVTLVTCEGYAGQLGEYSYRRVVEAVLTEVTNY